MHQERDMVGGGNKVQIYALHHFTSYSYIVFGGREQ